ncbi:uncharacterized protein MYCFIDRAFT_180142 [Pseudocercospora fijiensis CIRAD86]|uniref:Uncharacterized protein n=1 Tax=Pseudocercospora fijiensis (strain CIRAD86) TaxID=383855 RepID=M2ZDF5_PSEFD|nr:uncharacterized protein MYCFIDRAFT_180142 [Pseudocercospora fijiensis CIRAD86]EME77139.1 hypothetical protein MYCFIDRAFT_180142 [Pseudocercospora fijiensis CIRAD86]
MPPLATKRSASMRRMYARPPLSPDERLEQLLQSDAMRDYCRRARPAPSPTWYESLESFYYFAFRPVYSFKRAVLLVLALVALGLLCLWPFPSGPLENPPTIHAQQNGATLDGHHNPSASCAQICTSFDLLSLPAPAHPQILWLSSRATDYAPDWLRDLPLGWPLNSFGRTNSVVPPIWRTNALADQVKAEASQFVGLGVIKLLNRYTESFNSSTPNDEDQSVFQLHLHQLNLYSWLSHSGATPNEREALLAAMAWASDTADLDRMVRLRDAVSSGISELRTTIGDGVAHINQSIALGRGPWSPCHTDTDCVNEWRPDLDYLRLLTSWTHFVELNVLTCWHIADAMAFFTRYLSDQLGSDVDTSVIKEAYKKKLHYIGNRAGLYAARQWALDQHQISGKMVEACGTCFANTSAWSYWWQPYDGTATALDVLEPHDPILRSARLHGKPEAGRERGGFPIRAPSDFRKYKPALNGEHCLGIDHIWGDELDQQLEGKVDMRANDPYRIETQSLQLGLDLMWGKVWCIANPKLVKNTHLGLLEASEAYALHWVKDRERRWERRNFVHEAWNEEWFDLTAVADLRWCLIRLLTISYHGGDSLLTALHVETRIDDAVRFSLLPNNTFAFLHSANSIQSNPHVIALDKVGITCLNTRYSTTAETEGSQAVKPVGQKLRTETSSKKPEEAKKVLVSVRMMPKARLFISQSDKF